MPLFFLRYHECVTRSPQPPPLIIPPPGPTVHRARQSFQPRAKFAIKRAVTNPAQTNVVVGEGFIPSLPFAAAREAVHERVFAGGSPAAKRSLQADLQGWRFVSHRGPPCHNDAAPLRGEERQYLIT